MRLSLLIREPRTSSVPGYGLATGKSCARAALGHRGRAWLPTFPIETHMRPGYFPVKQQAHVRVRRSYSAEKKSAYNRRRQLVALRSGRIGLHCPAPSRRIRLALPWFSSRTLVPPALHPHSVLLHRRSCSPCLAVGLRFQTPHLADHEPLSPIEAGMNGKFSRKTV